MMADTSMTDTHSTDQNNNDDKTNVTDNSDEKNDSIDSESDATTGSCTLDKNDYRNHEIEFIYFIFKRIKTFKIHRPTFPTVLNDVSTHILRFRIFIRASALSRR